MIHLQQTLGNEAVQRMIKSNGIQAKLKVSQPSDPYEREADRVAELVMKMPPHKESNLPIKNTVDKKINRKCKSCEKEDEENEDLKKMSISRKEKNDSSSLDFDISDHLQSDINYVFSQQGSLLDTQTREFMESRFGYDFSRVRIHADEGAAIFSSSINSLAYTLGKNIVFGKGQ